MFARRLRWGMAFSLFICSLVLLGCQPKVIMSDDFAVPTDDWFLEGDAYGQSIVTDGRLFLQVNQPNTMQYTTLRQPLVKDFELEVDATLLSGSSNSSYGVLFRMQEGGAFYRFDIMGKGLYIIEKRHMDGTWTRISNGWQPSDTIRTGLNVTNRVKVSAENQLIVFSVNGEVIERIEGFDQAYNQGAIGLTAGTFTQTGLTVAFDNLIITQP